MRMNTPYAEPPARVTSEGGPHMLIYHSHKCRCAQMSTVVSGECRNFFSVIIKKCKWPLIFPPCLALIRAKMMMWWVNEELEASGKFPKGDLRTKCEGAGGGGAAARWGILAWRPFPPSSLSLSLLCWCGQRKWGNFRAGNRSNPDDWRGFDEATKPAFSSVINSLLPKLLSQEGRKSWAKLKWASEFLAYAES